MPGYFCASAEMRDRAVGSLDPVAPGVELEVRLARSRAPRPRAPCRSSRSRCDGEHASRCRCRAACASRRWGCRRKKSGSRGAQADLLHRHAEHAPTTICAKRRLVPLAVVVGRGAQRDACRPSSQRDCAWSWGAKPPAPSPRCRSRCRGRAAFRASRFCLRRSETLPSRQLRAPCPSRLRNRRSRTRSRRRSCRESSPSGSKLRRRNSAGSKPSSRAAWSTRRSIA